MHSDLLQDQAEARLIQLRQQRLRKPGKATGYVTDAIKTSVVPMPRMSFLTAQTGANVYATPPLSMGPASEALPALAPPFGGDLSQAGTPSGVAPMSAVASPRRAEVRQRSAFVAALFSWTYRAWLSGIRPVLRDTQTPLRYRLCQAKHGHPLLQKKPFVACCKRVLSWPLVLCSVWYALLEAWGVLYSLKPKQGFFVIQKPRLAKEHRPTHVQPVPTAKGSGLL